MRDALVAPRRLRGSARGGDRARGRARCATATRSSTPSAQAEDGELALGFHRAGRWDVIDDLSRRTSSPPSAWTRCARRREAWCREQGLSAYDRRTHDGLPAQPGGARGPAHRAAAGAARDQHGATSARTSSRPRCPADSVLWTQIEGVAETTRGGKTRTLKGDRRARGGARDRAASALRFRISPDAFFQTNTEMAERLYAAGRRAGGPDRPRAGVRPLLRHRHDRARARARARARWWAWSWSSARWPTRIENAKLNGDRQRALLRRRRPHRDAPADRGGGQGRRGGGRPAARRACRRRSCAACSRSEAKRIVYVSCNPTTLAPNARQMVDAGYELKTVRPVDMFPQTPHIESRGAARAASSAGGLSPPLPGRAATGSAARCAPPDAEGRAPEPAREVRRKRRDHRGVELGVGVQRVHARRRSGRGRPRGRRSRGPRTGTARAPCSCAPWPRRRRSACRRPSATPSRWSAVDQQREAGRGPARSRSVRALSS